MLRFLIVAVVVLLSASSQAAEDSANGMSASWTNPQINKAACADPENPVAIDISVWIGTAAPALTNTYSLYVWWASSSDAACTSPGAVPSDPITTKTLNADDEAEMAFLSGGESNALVFPFDDTETFTTADVWTQAGGCDAEVEKEVRLCFGLDLDTTAGITAGTFGTGDRYVSANFAVDTKAPPAPGAPGLTGLDGSIQVSAGFGSDAPGDVNGWEARFRVKPADETAAAAACESWDSPQTSGEIESTTYDSATFDFDATNGTTYQVCVIPIDHVGNRGPFSPVSEATPRAECDFIECYPDGLLTRGLCSAAGMPVWLLALPWLATAARRRMRRRKGEP